jgi:chemotaxis signal transduction protein
MIKTYSGASTQANTYCTVRLDGQLFGFDILTIREVNTQTTLTPVPHAPAAVRGYANLRGHIYLILDLKLLLGMEAGVIGPDSRLVICKASVGESFGMLVDQIGDIAEANIEAIERWRSEETKAEDSAAWRSSGLLAGVAKLDGELLLIVDSHKLLQMVAETIRA